MASETNPINIVHDSLWGLADASALLQSLVRLTNRIRFNQPGYEDPQKPAISDDDLPELSLFIQRMNGKLRSNSSGSELTATFNWVISTGDFSISRTAAPVAWALYCAMASWPSVAGALTWKGKTFIKRVDLQDVQFGLLEREQNRGIRGWSAVWGCEVYMSFTTSDLLVASGEIY